MPQSRREVLIGAGAVLTTAVRGPVALMIDADAMLLAFLTLDELEMVQQSMKNHPGLTAARALQALIAFGM